MDDEDRDSWSGVPATERARSMQHGIDRRPVAPAGSGSRQFYRASRSTWIGRGDMQSNPEEELMAQPNDETATVRPPAGDVEQVTPEEDQPILDDTDRTAPDVSETVASAPVLVDPATPPPGPVRSHRASWVPIAAIAALTVLAVVTTVLWISARNDLADTRTELGSVQTQLDAARSTVASYSAAAASNAAARASEAAEAAEVPDLAAVAGQYFTNVHGDAEGIQFTIGAYSMATLRGTLVLMLDELGFSSAVIERMEQTRALDGTLTAEGHNCNVSWTYHPDDGLSMVFEVEHP
jgi:hypothetical protein